MSWLDQELATVALCWRVERRDGVAVGLTAHDRDLTVDGLAHRASPGMSASAIVREAGLEPDTMDVAGALTAEAIGERDLLAGRWDGARVMLFAVDWTHSTGSGRAHSTGSGRAQSTRSGQADVTRRVDLGEGVIGAVETADGGFTAELLGSAAALDRPVAEETSPECRAELGDRRCRTPMAGRRRFARVVRQEDAVVVVDGLEPSPDAYGGGRVRWFGGANGGLESAVARSEGTALTLREPPRLAVTAGDLVELVEGCDKSLATCAGRFGNAANFRGEPYLPGIDLLTRFPGA